MKNYLIAGQAQLNRNFGSKEQLSTHSQDNKYGMLKSQTLIGMEHLNRDIISDIV